MPFRGVPGRCRTRAPSARGRSATRTPWSRHFCCAGSLPWRVLTVHTRPRPTALLSEYGTKAGLVGEGVGSYQQAYPRLPLCCAHSTERRRPSGETYNVEYDKNARRLYMMQPASMHEQAWGQRACRYQCFIRKAVSI